MTDTQAPLLELKGLRKAFSGVVAVDGVSLSLWPGELLALIGPNGSGKSTLFNTVSGLHKRTAGEIVWRGSPIKRTSLDRSCRLGMARTFQEATNFPDLTVRRCLELAAQGHRAEPDGGVITDALIDEMFEASGLDRVSNRPAGLLPYGQSRLLGIVMAVSTRPSLLMLDEPAAGISRDDVRRLSEVLRKLHMHGLTIALVDHDMSFVLGLATRVLVLSAGRVIFEGTPEAVVHDPLVRQAYLGDGHKRD